MQITEVLKSGAEDFKGWLILAEEVEALFGPMVTEKEFHNSLRESISNGLAFCVKQESEKRGTSLLGGIIISKKDNEIIWFAVSEKQRGKGLGDKLISHAIVSLDQSRPISVITFADNVEEGLPARRIYLKHGFIDKERRGLNPAGIPIALMIKA